MTEPENPIPPRLQEIIEDFQWSDGREKLELLLQYAEEMHPLPEWLQDKASMEQVEECMTLVYVQAELVNERMFFYFDVPKSSPTIRGYASILQKGLDGITPQEMLGIPSDFYHQLGLDKVLTHQRLNGIAAMIAHMKLLALKEMANP